MTRSPGFLCRLAVAAAAGAIFLPVPAGAELIFADGFESGDLRAWSSTVPAPGVDEWRQHAHDARRTGYTAAAVPVPWRWKWSWNGPDASGAISAGKTSLPRNVQPVTGGGRVYVARGPEGVVALASASGAVLWSRALGGSAQATPAYHGPDDTLLVTTADGRLHKLAASTGATVESAPVPGPATTPPLLLADRVVVSAGSRVVALAATDLSPIWDYDAGATVDTPPSYSPGRNRVVVGAADLHVHAVDNASGARVWRVKPTPHTPSEIHSYRHGWPVVAEAHGLVLVKLRLEWQSMWSYGRIGSNAEIRALLEGDPAQQALFALDLDTGESAFVCNVGHGGFGDNDYMPMGPQPVVKTFPDGEEVVYTVIRGTDGRYDERWDSSFGEMVLDNQTPGLLPGYVRWIRYPGTVDYLLTDEQPNLTMAGDQILGGHWMVGYAIRVSDRGDALGSYLTPIASEPLPHVVTSSNDGSFSPSHWDPDVLAQDGDARQYPFGFYVYWDQGPVYDPYWSEYASWVVSDGMVLFRSCDGAVVALEHGEPRAAEATAAEGPRAPEDRSGADHAPVRIRFDEARAHAGRRATVVGDIAWVGNNGKEILLGFNDPHMGAFKALIPRQAWPAFGPSLGTERGRDRAGVFRVGRRLAVHGVIGWYQGDPAIRVETPDQLEVADDDRL